MKNRTKILTILLGLAIVGLVIWQWSTDWKLVSNQPYPGFINEEQLDIPPQARAQWEAQLDTALAALVYDESDLSQIQTAAILEEQLGLYADARRHMEDVLEKNQINPANWTIYGDIALKMRDYETAELAYAKSLELGVDQQVVAKLEQLWREHLPSQMENIEPLYQDAIAADGQRTFYLVRLAEFYAERGRFDEAVSHMKVAADLDKDNQELQDAYEDMLVRAREAKQESK